MSKSPINKIFVFGASGHAKVVIDIIERQGLYEIALLVDDDTKLKGKEVYGYKVLDRDELLGRRADLVGGMVAIGSNRARQMVSLWLSANGFDLLCAVHPSAQIGRGVTIGAGAVIMAGVVVNSDAKIGQGVIVNTRASIDHDCVIDDFVHIAPGSTLCGNVSIGDGTFVCAGATIIPNLTIGKHVTIGAGSTVLHSFTDSVTAVGIPAREFKAKE